MARWITAAFVHLARRAGRDLNRLEAIGRDVIPAMDGVQA